MPTSDGKPTKSNEEIIAETEGLQHWLSLGPRSPEAQVLAAIYERLGDIWMWAKERR